MSVLKNKVRKALAAEKVAKSTKSVLAYTPEIPTSSQRILRKRIEKRDKVVKNSKDNIDTKSTKNIVKNYARAICNFAASTAARPYIDDLIQKRKEKIDAENFIQYLQDNKESLDCIDRLKAMLIVTSKDDKVLAAYKRVFKPLAEIFVKYFSVNWIYDSRITYKFAHLKFRFSLLRRIKNPEKFTYLTSHASKDQ